MNKPNKFVAYQRRDNPRCNYGTTGTLLIGSVTKKILFNADNGLRMFIKPTDVYTYGKPIKSLLQSTTFSSISG